jgi:hypothetical protein
MAVLAIQRRMQAIVQAYRHLPRAEREAILTEHYALERLANEAQLQHDLALIAQLHASKPHVW